MASDGSEFGLTADAALLMMKELRRTFDSGKTRSLEWRIEQLKGLKRLAEERREEIEEALKEDMNRCPAECVGEVLALWTDADMAIRNIHKWTRPQRVAGSPIFPLASFSCERQPLGVALIISPWNFPFSEFLKHPMALGRVNPKPEATSKRIGSV